MAVVVMIEVPGGPTVRLDYNPDRAGLEALARRRTTDQRAVLTAGHVHNSDRNVQSCSPYGYSLQLLFYRKSSQQGKNAQVKTKGHCQC